ncbi:helix-turn-helix transcriptional regulator [Aeromonas media]|uniref:helix-turn-helix transcriptional regulator n=1 Tax=Aeromonas media TaxID=651 RepID=UPI003D0754D0
MNSTTRLERILRTPEVLELLGISRSSLYGKINPKAKQFDASFPRPLKLGASSIGWRLSSLMAWIESLDGAATQRI